MAEKAQTVTFSDNAKSSSQHNFGQVTDKDQDLGAFEESPLNAFGSEPSQSKSKSLSLISLDKESEKEDKQSDTAAEGNKQDYVETESTLRKNQKEGRRK